MNFRNIILSKRSQTQKGTYHMILFVCLPRTSRQYQKLPATEGKKKGGLIGKRHNKISWGDGNVLHLLWVVEHGCTKWETFFKLNA